MTDDEINDLMYEHATAFSSCVQFSEQGVLDFARAVRDFAPAVVQPKPPRYTDDLWTFVENADQFIDAASYPCSLLGPALISASPKFGDELFQLLACFEGLRVVRIVVVGEPDNAVAV